VEKVHYIVSIGKYEYNNGEVYDGEWKDNKRNGRGKSITHNRHLHLS